MAVFRHHLPLCTQACMSLLLLDVSLPMSTQFGGSVRRCTGDGSGCCVRRTARGPRRTHAASCPSACYDADRFKRAVGRVVLTGPMATANGYFPFTSMQVSSKLFSRFFDSTLELARVIFRKL